MNVYIDDERNPKTKRNWIVVRSSLEFFLLVEHRGCPNYISFDHDLGENKPTGFDIARALVDLHLDGVVRIPDDFDFNVHSANPVGAINIEKYLRNFLLWRDKCSEQYL